MEIIRRNHFELKIKTLPKIKKDDNEVNLYVSKYFDLADTSILELSYFSRNLSLSVSLPKMPTSDLERRFTSDFIIKHRVSSYLPSETKELDNIYQDFYGVEKQNVLVANSLAMETLRGIPFSLNSLTKNVLNSPVSWIVFCHAVKQKELSTKFIHFILENNKTAYLNPVFDILPFVHEDIDLAF